MEVQFVSDEFVLVPVPTQHVRRVYRFLANLDGEDVDNAMRSSDAAQVASPAEDFSWINPHEAPKRDWPPETIRRCTIESNDNQKGFLRYLAQHPGQVFTTQQLVDGLGVGRTDVTGAHGGISRRTKSRYKMAGLFYTTYWDGVTASYQMDEREAAIVLEALGR